MSVLFRVEDPVEGARRVPVPEIAETTETNGTGRLSSARASGAMGARSAEQAIPASVLAWLQDILRERFHADLLLKQVEPAFCELTIPGDAHAIRISSAFGRFEHSDPADLPCTDWQPRDTRWLPRESGPLPAPGYAALPASVVEHDAVARMSTLHYDVLSLAYWMLSRREELGAAHALDDNQRFRAEASHAGRHGYLERPVVDEWLEVLRRLVRSAWPELPLRETQYRTCVSHDVDSPARYGFIGPLRLTRAMCADALRGRPIRTVLRAPSIRLASARQLDPRDPYNTFDWIMQRSEDSGLRSAFYFICGHTDHKRDGHYTPEHPAIIDLLRRIHARGHEIGLHPSYHCYRDPEALQTEAARLRRACDRAGVRQAEIGARMHYLRWEMPTTLHALEAAGVVYDTTPGWAKHPGFRCGTCHEYPAFDPLTKRALRLRIRPLVVMESTVLRGAKDDPAALESRLRQLMETCQRVNGQFTVLWHNTMLEHAWQRTVYERMLLSGRRARS